MTDIFVPARDVASVQDDDDILSGLLPEAADVFVLEVQNEKYTGALCRIVNNSNDEDRVSVKLLIEQTIIRVLRKAILTGMTRATLLSLGLKVMLPLARAQCSLKLSTVQVNLSKAAFEANIDTLIDEIVKYNANNANTMMRNDYKPKMQEALARLPHRLKTDLLIVCCSIANADLFSQMEAKANICVQRFTVFDRETPRT